MAVSMIVAVVVSTTRAVNVTWLAMGGVGVRMVVMSVAIVMVMRMSM